MSDIAETIQQQCDTISEQALLIDQLRELLGQAMALLDDYGITEFSRLKKLRAAVDALEGGDE